MCKPVCYQWQGIYYMPFSLASPTVHRINSIACILPEYHFLPAVCSHPDPGHLCQLLRGSFASPAPTFRTLSFQMPWIRRSHETLWWLPVPHTRKARFPYRLVVQRRPESGAAPSHSAHIACCNSEICPLCIYLYLCLIFPEQSPTPHPPCWPQLSNTSLGSKTGSCDSLTGHSEPLPLLFHWPRPLDFRHFLYCSLCWSTCRFPLWCKLF